MILDDEIRQLMEYLESSNLFEIEREGIRLKLVRRPPQAPDAVPTAAVPAAAGPAPAPAPAPASVPAESPDQHLVRSPIVGTFYRASAPDAKPFADAGDRVTK